MNLLAGFTALNSHRGADPLHPAIGAAHPGAGPPDLRGQRRGVGEPSRSRSCSPSATGASRTPSSAAGRRAGFHRVRGHLGNLHPAGSVSSPDCGAPSGCRLRTGCSASSRSRCWWHSLAVLPHLGIYVSWMLPVAIVAAAGQYADLPQAGAPPHAADRRPLSRRQADRSAGSSPGITPGALCVLATTTLVPVLVAVHIGPGHVRLLLHRVGHRGDA